MGDYKMEEFLLFNMDDRMDDRQETHGLEEHDLSRRYPERFAALKTKLLAHDKAVRTEGGTLDVAERMP